MRSRRTVLSLLLLMAPVVLRAQSPARPLDALVEEALRANLGLAVARLSHRQAEAGVREARGRLLPTLDVDARWSEVSGVLDLGTLVNPAYAALNQLTGTNTFPTDISATVPTRQDMRLKAVLPLFSPSAWAAYELSRRQRDVSRERLGSTAREIAAGVQLAYLQYAVAARSVELLRGSLDIVEENLRTSERLAAAGTATPDAVYRARADRSEVVQRLADAEQRRDAAARAVNQLLQRPLTAPVEVFPDSTVTPAVRLPLEETLTAARDRREEIREAAYAERVAHSAVRLQTASFLPTVALAGDVGYQGNRFRFTRENDFAIASLVLQWNLFRGGSDNARRQQATLAADQARIGMREVEQRVELEVRQAWEAVAVSETELAAATDRAIAARRTFELVRRRYEEGLASHLELIAARVDYTNAGLNEVLTRYAHAARLVQLERAAALRTLPL